MRSFARKMTLFNAGVVAATLSACSQSAPPAQQQADSATPEPVQVAAPAGRYALDPNHSSLNFSVNHVGLSNYVARFTKYQVTIDLDPQNLGASSVVATIDPTSIRTDYSGDYRGAHKDSPFGSWEEDLAQSPKFFNAAQHPQIEFRSTRVEQTGPGAMRIVGDLTLLGQVHPVTLEATLVGSSATHPFYGGGGAIGFSAAGSFNRSAFGMNHLLEPLLVGDTVTIEFEGEFQQVVTQPATPAS